MSFFGIQVGLLQVTVQNADAKIYYCILSASRIESIENMDFKDTLTPIYTESTGLSPTVDQDFVDSTPTSSPQGIIHRYYALLLSASFDILTLAFILLELRTHE
jgi:hypothetical protein